MKPGTWAEEDLAIVGRCLRAALDGPFFEDWELATLFGFERDELAQLAKKWPEVDFKEGAVLDAVQATLGHLLFYPHQENEALERLTTSTREELRKQLTRWEAFRNEGLQPDASEMGA